MGRDTVNHPLCGWKTNGYTKNTFPGSILRLFKPVYRKERCLWHRKLIVYRIQSGCASITSYLRPNTVEKSSTTSIERASVTF